MAEAKDIFTRAKDVRFDIDRLTADVKRGKEALRKAKAELAGLRKQVLDALGRKVRGPRKKAQEPAPPPPADYPRPDKDGAL